jgi:hypothetical protein
MIIMTGILLLVAGCGGGNVDEPPQTPAPEEPTATPEPEPDFGLVDIAWTSAIDEDTGEPVDEIEAFTTVSPGIVAAVEANNVPAGTGFTAEWTIDGLEVPEATMNVTVEQDMSTAWIAFEFIRDEGRYFPLGELEVVVTASSGETIDGSVTIQLP